jgi:hypothetical protein
MDRCSALYPWRKMPEADTPYKVSGFLFCLLFSLFKAFIWLPLATMIFLMIGWGKIPFVNSAFGMLLTAMGIPLFFYFKGRSRPRPASRESCNTGVWGIKKLKDSIAGTGSFFYISSLIKFALSK